MLQQSTGTAEAIRAAGRRSTTQRVVVMDIIKDLRGHVTVDQIVAKLHEAYPQIDVATVYRTVGLLSRLHLINEVAVGGVTHYEFSDPADRHHHMVCEHCGITFHLEPAYLDGLHDRLLQDTGFELHTEHLTVSGLCKDCRRNLGHSHNGHTHAQAQDHRH